MGDILGNAVTGLLSFQRALSTTSHNIANVNTDGYSRQRVDLGTRNPTYFGGSYVGSGVQIETVQRSYDQFIASTLRETNSTYYRLEKFTELSSQIDNILADPQGGISPVMQSFFSAVQDVSDDPSSGSARYQLISSAEAMVNRFSTFDTRLQQLTDNTETDIQTVITEINQIVSSITDINQKLEETNASGSLSQQSSDLLDQRDHLLDELSTRINIQVINPDNNNITVLVGNGQTMLTGTTAFSLGVQPDQADPSQNVIVYNGFSSVNDLSDQLNGGELGGLLDYRSNVLNPTKNTLGRIAIGLADTFNEQHREGMDLNDALGGDFFSFSQPRSIPNSANTGAATVTTTITDINQLTVDDYTLSYDGANWNILSTSGSSGTLTPPTDTFEGLTINIAGVAVAGDQFEIKPTAEGSRSIDVVISDPNAIAAAAPIRAQSSLSNLGDISISQGIITDGSNPTAIDPATFTPVTLTFTTPATVPVTLTATEDVIVSGTAYAAGASIPYSNNMVIDSDPNAWQVSLSGINPQPGDTLTIEANIGGSGDNRNMLDLSSLQTTGFFDNGNNTYQEAYSVLNGQVGAITHSAEVDRQAQGSLLAQAVDRRSQESGVNLDEEAADLIKYQQAYEAAARVISAAQTLFESLINSTR